jgi:hypothetical protein
MPDSESIEPTDLPSEITKSLGSVWRRYSEDQPVDAETEIDGDVVRCVLTDAVGGFNRGIAAASADDAAESERPLTEATYRRDAIAAVSRITRRRVLAFVSNHDSKTDIAREVFVLEPLPRRRP